MNMKSPSQIKSWLEQHQHEFDSPAAYYGDEPNTVDVGAWEAYRLRHLVVAAFGYSFMGNHAIPLLYELFNKAKPGEWLAERMFFTNSQRETSLLKRHGIPFFSLESKHAMGAFHTVGFTVNWMPQVFNVHKMLQLSGIPVWREEREEMREAYPLIFMGSNAACNPFAMKEMIDVFWLGEIEDEPDNPGMHAVWSDIEEAIRSLTFYTKDGREQLLHRLSSTYDFLFIPSMIKTVWAVDAEDVPPENYLSKAEIKGWQGKYPDCKTSLKKHTVHNLDNASPLLHPYVSYLDTTMGVGSVESSRGCPAHCVFCSSGLRQGPFRVRDEEELVDAFKENVRTSGTNNVAPITLEYGDFPTKKRLFKRLVEECCDQLALLSIRTDVWENDPTFAQVFTLGAGEQVTLAVEGNSQRLRTAMAKGLTEEMILSAVNHTIAAGIQRLKIYLISGLPGETDADIQEVIALARKVDDIRRQYQSKIQITFSWTPMNIQAFTPVQWCAVGDLDERRLYEVFKPLTEELHITCAYGKKAERNIRYFVQLCELADSRISKMLLQVLDEVNTEYHGGIRRNVYEVCDRKLKEMLLSWGTFFGAKPYTYRFDWDCISFGASKDYLIRQHELMMRAIEGNNEPDARPGYLTKHGKCNYGCDACGACQTAEEKKRTLTLWDAGDDVDLSETKVRDERSVAVKYRYNAWISPDKRFVTNGHWKTAIRRAAYMAHIPISKYSIKMSSDAKDFKGWTAGHEIIEFALTKDVGLSVQGIARNLNQNLRGITIIGGERHGPDALPLRRDISVRWYQMEIQEHDDVVRRVAREFQARVPKTLVLLHDVHRRGIRHDEYDLYKMVKDMWFKKSGTRLYMHVLITGKATPYDIYRCVFDRKAPRVYRFPAVLLDSYVNMDGVQEGFYNTACEECGMVLPVNPLGESTFKDDELPMCPKCAAKAKGDFIA